MGLPKIQQPLFELVVPSTEQKVKYRPFVVKEEKILLVAQESKDFDQVVLAIKQIVNNCMEGVDVDELAMFDLEYVLINIRAKSVNNEFKFTIKDPDSKETVELSVDIEDIKVQKDPNHNKMIRVNDDITLMMKYPSLDQLKMLNGTKSKAAGQIDVMLSCIDKVVSGDQIYNLADFSKEEVEEFLDSFTNENVMAIKTFFDTMPVLRYEKNYTLKDGTEKKIVMQGTETFFI